MPSHVVAYSFNRVYHGEADLAHSPMGVVTPLKNFVVVNPNSLE
jgi:hypothetical protein